jgi:hypothetical protein
METRTIIDKIEIDPQTGNVGVRMKKQIVEGELVLAEHYHRTTIDTAADPAAQMALVNAHLATMGYPAIRNEDVAVLHSAMAPLASLRAAKGDAARAKEPK